jgi:hypothetical protein
MKRPVGALPLAFVTNGPVKLANLRARPQVTATFRNGWQWAAVEGHAELAGPDDPQPWPAPERLRLLLREIFSAGGGEHNDWDTYDRVMAEERRATVPVRPDRVYTSDEHGHEDVPRLAWRGPGVLRRSRSRQLQGLVDCA